MLFKIKYEQVLGMYAFFLVVDKLISIKFISTNYFAVPMAVIGLLLFRHRLIKIDKHVLLPFFLFALWVLFSVVWSRYVSILQFMHISIIIMPIVLSILIILLGITSEELKNVNKYSVIGGVVVAIYLLFFGESYTDGTNATRFVIAMNTNNGYGDPNFLALLLIYPIFILLVKAEKKLSSVIDYALVILFLYVLFLLGSRGTIISIFITIILKSIIERRYKELLLIILGIASLGWYVYDSFYEIIGKRFDVDFILETGGAGRTDIWKVAWEMIKDNFIAGVGIYNSSNIYDYYSSIAGIGGSRGYGRIMHNLYIEILVELGLVGFVLYFSIIVEVFVKKIKNLKDECPEIVYSFVAISISSCFLHTLSEKIIWFMLAVLGGYRLRNAKKN